MDQVTEALALIVYWLRVTLGVVLGLFAAVQHWAEGELTQAGIVGPAQRWAMVVITVLLIVLAVRVFGGALRAILTVLLFLMLLQLMLPVMTSLPGTSP